MVDEILFAELTACCTKNSIPETEKYPIVFMRIFFRLFIVNELRI